MPHQEQLRQQANAACQIIEGLNIPDDQKALLFNQASQSYIIGSVAIQFMHYNAAGIRAPSSRIFCYER